jgi:nitrogen fixation/metabolism regulation signal transduction histidine kinase
MRRFSLEGKLATILALAVSAGSVGAALLVRWFDDGGLALALTLLVLLPPALLLGRQLARPVADLIRVLSGAVASFRDRDFSFSIHSDRRDELRDLVDAHNELGRVLREERQHLFQRELLLDTVVQNSPNALLLIDSAGHVVYSNQAARQLLNGGRKLEGLAFGRMLAECPEPMREAVAAGVDAIFTVTLDGNEESFHLSAPAFNLNGRRHRLYVFRRLTRELSRQEVATWKKVIRVISHELNNSLAPISSLAHSGRELVARGDSSTLVRVFETIEERTRHLDGFIRGYAQFAKLPSPRIEAVYWPEFIARLAQQVRFRSAAPIPEARAHFDPAQLAQALLNLIKNAHEAGGASEDVELAVLRQGGGWRIEVSDRGSGMSEAVMANALVPFYSTKRSGTGLGLALAREIAEAHGGRIGLANRPEGGLSVALWLPEPTASDAAPVGVRAGGGAIDPA